MGDLTKVRDSGVWPGLTYSATVIQAILERNNATLYFVKLFNSTLFLQR